MSVDDLVRELRAARLANQEAKGVQRDAVKAWSDEKDAHEPERVKSFRKYLLSCECVREGLHKPPRHVLGAGLIACGPLVGFQDIHSLALPRGRPDFNVLPQVPATPAFTP